jgi:hypothetical protein
MSEFTQMLLTFGIGLGVAGAFVGGAVWIELWRQRKEQRRLNAQAGPRDDHVAGWDYVVDGEVVAELRWLGPPEDLNTGFVPFEVTAAAGREEEVEALLYRSNHREPMGDRVCYRSRGNRGLVLSDSQVLVGNLGGNRINLKAYW